MSASEVASSIDAGTAVPRTTRTSGVVERIVSASASSLRSGWYITPHPAAFRPSSPLRSNLSATSTFIDDLIGFTVLCFFPSNHSSNQVRQQAVPQLRLEPRRLRRHDRVRV